MTPAPVVIPKDCEILPFPEASHPADASFVVPRDDLSIAVAEVSRSNEWCGLKVCTLDRFDITYCSNKRSLTHSVALILCNVTQLQCLYLSEVAGWDQFNTQNSPSEGKKQISKETQFL